MRAIRTANPPGRFLKKNEDGFWYDVGNRYVRQAPNFVAAKDAPLTLSTESQQKKPVRLCVKNLTPRSARDRLSAKR